ncbi:membrane protein [Pontibacillus chungwhensis BH030062]|uniref:Membrane protein n=1 Tax=Pontibacillus chungwhensis BH030062 TaxID=1385513 RepID=A0A0A2UYG5_9BACI|nr:RDD family protein [Pontibacillus chungwhensis]KGP91798.1 membrane protein [Pontibacillus chungwhensis BH030062]
MERPAGFGVRLLANLIDGIIVGVILSFITFLFYGDFYKEDYNITDLLSTLYLIIVPVVWKGYVIGKRLMNIRIVKKNGENVTILTMILRVIVAGLLYGLTIGIAFIVSAIMVAVREDKRAIHDFIAGTYVINER